ncbi:MAG TPA: hypothetical protein QF720_01430 [Nitrospinota bacterium]|nr:hypothetical protein [Nitrospinota bacterium]|tara:strand:+ start:3926 stop:4579 length:654 start_codon:yes stop_codon:yes gene_type:complete
MKSGNLNKAWLVKVGGSLQTGNALSPLLNVIEPLGRRADLVIFPGGGLYADFIRMQYANGVLSDDLAHEQAILAMDQFGHELAAGIASSSLTRTREEASTVLQRGEIPIFVPYPFAVTNPDIPKSWDATSDTISAHVANYLGVSRIVLLKSVDGFVVNGELKVKVNHAELSHTSIVDSLFCQSLPMACDCYILNGNHPERLVELLETGKALMTKVCH